MSIRHVAAICAGLAVTGLPAGQAADVTADPARPVLTRAYCPPQGHSSLAGLPIDIIRTEVSGRYINSVDESEARRTVFSRSPRFVWAVASRQACGIALGYLSTGEINGERLWNCECYHARMLSYLPRR
jgi:hypothetical protein